MKLKIIITVFLGLVVLNAFAEDCHGTAMTQYEMNMCAGADVKETDAKLNRIYKKILSINKADQFFIDKMQKSKRAWLKFRDAQMLMKYPPREEGYYGSVLPMCKSLYYIELTEKRISDEVNLQETVENQRKAVMAKYEINKRALSNYKDAAAELNRLYENILGANKADKVFIGVLRKSQQAWLEYRDAQVALDCPSSRYYGAVHLVCVNTYSKELTEKRIIELKSWIDGEDEGEACGGSVPIKEEAHKGAISRGT